MRFYSYFIVTIILSSCGTSAKVGKYRSGNGALLRVNSDSTYHYEFREGWHRYISFGKWKTNEEDIVFSSSYNTTNFPLKAREYYEGNSNEIRFNISDVNEIDTSLLRELSFAIIIDDQNYVSSRTPNMKLSTPKSIGTLRVIVKRNWKGIPYLLNDSLVSSPYKVIDQKSNKFDFKIASILEDFYTQFWNNKTFRFKRNRLVDELNGQQFFRIKG
jgi:hypothetical protein